MKKYLALAFVFILFSCSNDDDDTVEACVEATNIRANNITTTSATISWDDANEAGSYTIEYGLSGFTVGSGTTVNASLTSTELLNLAPETTYDVYVQVDCSSNNSSLYSEVLSFTTATLPVIPEFRPNLSELNLFSGDLSDLNISSKAFEYQLSTQLFTDYAHKQRIIALPENTSLVFDGDGLPIFPDNTVIAKTFYYNADERDLALGRTILETRILIKINGTWETGDYKWNAEQTEAVLDLTGSTVPVTWIDESGTTNSINYEIPSNTDCFTCHSSFGNVVPIGPKLRSMNFDINGVNQLNQFISNGYLTGVDNSSSVRGFPNWEDTSLSLEDRARAYMDINCAHCHIPGGHCENESTLDLAFETSLEDSNIVERSFSIDYRISTDIDGIGMPFIGTTILHTEGVQLIQDYLNTLD
ncbi:fibronectin type III domain-containing protein [Winogradskyella pulchriflava]|uniref:Fibronectin type III domain-containing protein n=1 Tax=Winogradskyella pulchriflava TaxID=1110688 RepID=A0ABV6Q5E4_9FLAO